MPLTGKRINAEVEISNLTTLETNTSNIDSALNDTSIDIIQLRSQILSGDTTFGDYNYVGSFNSLYFDGICDTTERTTGMPIMSNNPLITFPTAGTAITMSIASTSALDTGFGVFIKGLDSNWEEISTSVTMNGQTPVTIDTDFMRIIHKMFVYDLDGTGLTQNQGDIYVSDDGASFTDGQPDEGEPVYYAIQKGYNWSE